MCIRRFAAGMHSCTFFMASALISWKYDGEVTGGGKHAFFSRGELVFTLCKNFALVTVGLIETTGQFEFTFSDKTPAKQYTGMLHNS